MRRHVRVSRISANPLREARPLLGFARSHLAPPHDLPEIVDPLCNRKGAARQSAQVLRCAQAVFPKNGMKIRESLTRGMPRNLSLVVNPIRGGLLSVLHSACSVRKPVASLQ